MLGPVIEQSVLQIDAGERRRKLTQIGGGRADQAGELTEAPVGWRDRRVSLGQHQFQPLGVVARRLHADGLALDDARLAAFGSVLHRIMQVREGQIPLVGRTVEPFRRHAANVLAPADVQLITVRRSAYRRLNFHLGHGLAPQRVPGASPPVLHPSPLTGLPSTSTCASPREARRAAASAGRRPRIVQTVPAFRDPEGGVDGESVSQ